MKLDIYLNYGGNCRQAFRFYEQHLGATITSMMTHGQQPNPAGVPDNWKDAVLHARMTVGGTVVMGADIPPERFQPMRSAYLTLTVDRAEEAERIYALLSDGGEIYMKMEQTFFANRFAMLRDRFGTSWMLLHQPQAA
jgi:PhnB protein